MIYGFLAGLVVGFHFLFIVFAVAGGALALRWRWMPWVHLPALTWGATVEFTGWVCPLTPLENMLRRSAGSTTYADGFIERYLVPLIYPDDLTREWQFALGGTLLIINAAIYAVVWRRRRELHP